MSKYVNPIDSVIKSLESEKQRRVNALNSNQFCDNDMLKRNIEVLNCGIKAMQEQRKLDKSQGRI